MFSFFDEVPSSTSLLMQCGYRSKVCTNHRATKLDGTLHKLCEFHRRKANLNQQRLHKRQREKRARVQMRESAEVYQPNNRPVKKARANLEPIVDLVTHSSTDSYYPISANEGCHQYAPLASTNDFALPKIGMADMDILELLLLDMQPQVLPPLEAFLPSASAPVDDKSSVVV